ncbi:cation diffusion facilitator family transporter [uncultured Draconibacterium sp.]|uniref:cation diffusion facilitator family transporter n=1 Tax=uncultured Draconibacterium sp. TaxID=1573823 RepID=UPI0029C99BDE|nr:cation diffusion facilitator family transporter [uncultured Draconibacterium sp.]
MQNNKYIFREGWISIIANTILFALKYWAGIVTGSVALIADAWHTLTDSVSSVIVLIGGKISSKPADDDHPFGHGRAEHIAAVIIGVLLAIVAFDFVLKSVDKFGTNEQTVFGTIAWIATIISIVVKELLAQYAFFGFRQTNSSILKADGWHHRTDALSSVVILVGLLFGKYFWWTDAVLGLIVAGMIGYASFEILSKEIKSLLGESPSDELLEEIHKTVDLNCKIQVNLHHIHLHKYGHHTEMSCHIKLPSEMTLYETHEICTKIEKAIKSEFGFITTIHPEPLNDNLKTFERY